MPWHVLTRAIGCPTYNLRACQKTYIEESHRYTFIHMHTHGPQKCPSASSCVKTRSEIHTYTHIFTFTHTGHKLSSRELCFVWKNTEKESCLYVTSHMEWMPLYIGAIVDDSMSGGTGKRPLVIINSRELVIFKSRRHTCSECHKWESWHVMSRGYGWVMSHTHELARALGDVLRCATPCPWPEKKKIGISDVMNFLRYDDNVSCITAILCVHTQYGVCTHNTRPFM